MMLIYWTSYLYIIEDKLEMDTFWSNPYVIWYFYTRKMDYHNFLFLLLIWYFMNNPSISVEMDGVVK